MPCTACMSKYTYLNKEHGCANCSFGFCSKCLTKKFLLPRLSKNPMPVCEGCFQTLSKGVVQPFEKTRHESTKNKDGKWWGPDEKPPPSMRHQYTVKPKLLNNPKSKAINAEKDEDTLANRFLANLTGRSADEIKNPRFMVSDRDGAEIPTSSTQILNSLRPSDAPQLPAKLNVDDKMARELNLPTVPPAEDSIEGLEERLAALRNVPVDLIRNPRLMVMKDDDSEPELDDEAKDLLNRAEHRLRKREPDLFACYQNEGLDSSDEEVSKPPSSTKKSK